MNSTNRRKFVLAGLCFIVAVLVVLQTGLAANDWIFFGLIVTFLLLQIGWCIHLVRQSRREEYVRLLNRNFPND